MGAEPDTASSDAAGNGLAPLAKVPKEPAAVKFSPEEEAALLKESHDIKAEANSLFASQDYHNALSRYDDAIATCPNYLHYARAVLQSNIAACHLQLEQWKEAIEAATDAIDGLAKLEPEGPKPSDADPSVDTKSKTARSSTQATEPSSKAPGHNQVEDEVVSSGAARSAPAPAPAPAPASSPEQADVLRIRTKALLRRARARSEAGGWQNLAGAEEDYRALSLMPGLAPVDMRTVRSQLKALPARTKAAQEAEMGELWGKLRSLGDGMLKPFGLSTNNFQMVKDENTGGYSMNFTQGGGAPS